MLPNGAQVLHVLNQGDVGTEKTLRWHLPVDDAGARRDRNMFAEMGMWLGPRLWTPTPLPGGLVCVLGSGNVRGSAGDDRVFGDEVHPEQPGGDRRNAVVAQGIGP